MWLIGEFVGSVAGMVDNLFNFIEFAMLGILLFLVGRAIYWEVLDLVTILIWALSGAGIRTSSEYGTLTDIAGRSITGVRFFGNKAYSGNRTFTNDGSGYFN